MAYEPGDKLPNGEIVNALIFNGKNTTYKTTNGNTYIIPNNTELECFSVKEDRCKWNNDGVCTKPIIYINK